MKTPYNERDYTFGQVMFTLRSKIGITQEQMGKIVGISGRSVSEWETGNSYPKAERLKAFIALAVQCHAFAEGSEASEIRALWRLAHQRILLDENWLCALLSGLPSPQGQRDEELPSYPAPPHGVGPAEEAMSSVVENQPLVAGIIDNHSPWSIVKAGSTPHSLPPAPNKTRKRGKWLFAILITLCIMTIIGSVGVFFFQTRETRAYLTGSGTLVLSDPLREASGSKWIVWIKPGWSPGSMGGPCEFIGGTYHAIAGKDSTILECPASVAFGNFIFEVRLTIVQGDCGGVFFRDIGRHTYYFSICQSGLYNVFDRAYKQFGYPGALDLSNYSSAIHTGPGQQNTIAVEASGSRMIFYVNKQPIHEEQDPNPTSGGIGLLADPHYHNPTDVAFSNARVWTL